MITVKLFEYEATKKEIKLIKQAIKKHNMKSVTWQSVASRPETIGKFLKDTGIIK